MTVHSTGTVDRILFQCDGKAMWLRTSDSRLSLFSCPELKWIRSFSISRAPLLASPELLVMLDPANRKRIRLFRSRDGQELSPLDAHDGDVTRDVGTRQELLTLAGIDSNVAAARWSADGDVIFAGPPWQAWSAPSWEQIAAAEAGEKTEIKQP
jgi:hypothetical protein